MAELPLRIRHTGEEVRISDPTGVAPYVLVTYHDGRHHGEAIVSLSDLEPIPTT